MTTLKTDTQLTDAPPVAAESMKYRLRAFLVRFRLPLLLVGHLVIFAGVYWVAFLMRFTLDVPAKYMSMFWSGLPIVVLTKLIAFYLLGSFHGWWRHVNFSDFVSLVRSALVASCLIVAFDYFVFQTFLPQIPRTVLLNDFVLTIVVLGGLRSCWRLWDERIAPFDRKRVRDRALLIGNDYHAARMAHLINGQHGMAVRIVGLVSPTKYPKGRRYSDIRVVGRVEELHELMLSHRTNTLFVITGSLQGRELRELLDSASDQRFTIKVLPPLEDQLQGSDKVSIREVSYNDLLRRKPVNLDTEQIGNLIEGKTILVTGAGGSIGSELCRQLIRFAPSQLVLLGRGENRIYQLNRELSDKVIQTQLIQRIANITDEKRIEEIFAQHQPDIVFHAAAHKHVPLVEQNVGEAIINNVLGTKVVADAADRHSVKKFVMVSTDKAVNPTSIMGCTKQMAERYCQALNSESETAFVSTRFGNVLGSAGSVVPLFQEQIRNGGPITITDKRMTRYFMTIPEASQLVIQAGAMGKGGEIFVLEMGKPVKILDLAKDLIRLAGHAPDSIEIVETGLREGEKMYEELSYEAEESLPTSHSQILSLCSRSFELTEVDHQARSLIEVAFDRNRQEICRLMKAVIPEYSTGNEKVQLRDGEKKRNDQR